MKFGYGSFRPKDEPLGLREIREIFVAGMALLLGGNVPQCLCQNMLISSWQVSALSTS